MKSKSFKTSFTVEQSPKEVFDAINNVRGWWSEGLVGQSDKVGATFTYQHKDFHVSTQKVTELAPGRKVVWHVSDSQITFVKNKAEWDDTELVFEIAKKGGRTEVTLTHEGLVPKLECFEDCSGGWSHYFGGSLKQLITTGKGSPDPKKYADSKKYPIKKDTDFTVSITVDQSPKEAFTAIKNIRGWWSQNIEGATGKVGDEFTYRYEDAHHCTMRLVESAVGRKLTWLVTDNYFSFTKDKTEWKGTKISFDIVPVGKKTEIRFTHYGLAPAYECFDVCSDAWSSYIKGSLRNLIKAGKGKPNPKESPENTAAAS